MLARNRTSRLKKNEADAMNFHSAIAWEISVFNSIDWRGIPLIEILAAVGHRWAEATAKIGR